MAGCMLGFAAGMLLERARGKTNIVKQMRKCIMKKMGM